MMGGEGREGEREGGQMEGRHVGPTVVTLLNKKIERQNTRS